MASRHQQNRAEKRERLLRAAVESFVEAGFENTTVSDVVHRAGLTPSTFYNYYRDKDALRDEILEVAAGQMVAALASIRARGLPPAEYLATACRGLFGAMVQDPTMAALLRRNLPLLRSLLDHGALAPVYRALRGDLAASAERGQSGQVNAEFAGAVLRAATLELAVVLLSSEEPDVEGAVAFLTRVLASAFLIR